MQYIKNCTAVILTGGESKRMGSDKADIILHGKPMLQHVIEQVEHLFSEVFISVREFRGGLNHQQMIDDSDSVARGPMVGIKKALEEVKTDWVFVIGCDMPFASTELIRQLALKRSLHDAVVPFAYHRVQPLFGFYHKSCLPLLERKMNQGQRSMIRLLGELDTYALSEEEVKLIDPELRSLISLDTVEAVQEMEHV